MSTSNHLKKQIFYLIFAICSVLFNTAQGKAIQSNYMDDFKILSEYNVSKSECYERKNEGSIKEIDNTGIYRMMNMDEYSNAASLYCQNRILEDFDAYRITFEYNLLDTDSYTAWNSGDGLALLIGASEQSYSNHIVGQSPLPTGHHLGKTFYGSDISMYTYGQNKIYINNEYKKTTGLMNEWIKVTAVVLDSNEVIYDTLGLVEKVSINSNLHKKYNFAITAAAGGANSQVDIRNLKVASLKRVTANSLTSFYDDKCIIRKNTNSPNIINEQKVQLLRSDELFNAAAIVCNRLLMGAQNSINSFSIHFKYSIDNTNIENIGDGLAIVLGADRESYISLDEPLGTGNDYGMLRPYGTHISLDSYYQEIIVNYNHYIYPPQGTTVGTKNKEYKTILIIGNKDKVTLYMPEFDKLFNMKTSELIPSVNDLYKLADFAITTSSGARAQNVTIKDLRFAVNEQTEEAPYIPIITPLPSKKTYTWFLRTHSDPMYEDMINIDEVSLNVLDDGSYLSKSNIPLNQNITYEWARDNHKDDSKNFTIVYGPRPTIYKIPENDYQLDGAVEFKNYWGYIRRMIFWGGSIQAGNIIAPDPELIDEGHAYGVKMFGTVFLPPIEVGGGLDECKKLATTGVINKLVAISNHLNFEGWFLNVEGTENDKETCSRALANTLKSLSAEDQEKFIVYFVDSSNFNYQDFNDFKGELVVDNNNMAHLEAVIIKEAHNNDNKYYLNTHDIDLLYGKHDYKNLLYRPLVGYMDIYGKHDDPNRSHLDSAVKQFFEGMKGLDTQDPDLYPWNGLAKYTKYGSKQ